jgi:hypothetical protein
MQLAPRRRSAAPFRPSGMSLGAWMAGELFDLTGFYQPAFLNGVMWNMVNIAIVAWLLVRLPQRPAKIAPAAASLAPR